MLPRTAFKWLSITVIVLVGFLMVLLFLGYLLKENAETTTKLKAKLEQDAYQQQVKENRKRNPYSQLSTSLNLLEKSQQKIIADNLSCQTDKQCFLIHTHSQALGCIVTLNTTGAAILLKVFPKNENQQGANRHCQQEYAKQDKLFAQCINSQCSF
jgi:short subunit fatty acids transporter